MRSVPPDARGAQAQVTFSTSAGLFVPGEERQMSWGLALMTTSSWLALVSNCGCGWITEIGGRAMSLQAARRRNPHLRRGIHFGSGCVSDAPAFMEERVCYARVAPPL